LAIDLNFRAIPGWVSLQNQGANVAVADLDGDGIPELIVLRVDHAPPAANRAFYRIGRKLDATGAPQGGWEPWIEIPKWGAAENQGAGIAIANLGTSGACLVVFQVEHVEPGPNRGLYRIGRKLDAKGAVTGGWSPWQEVPNWISWRDQGAAIAVHDLDGDGIPELVVLHIDDFHTNHPQRPNKAFYRVGRQLDDNGLVANWEDWLEVDWFSWFNQGAGIALADLDGDGRPELVTFQIDSPPGENSGFYRIGWGVDSQGQVHGGWGPWTRCNGWQSFEDQGGGVALAQLGTGQPKLVVLHVDAPVGLNEGRIAVADLEVDLDQASSFGSWRLLPYLSPVLPVHAGLLRTGKVLFFAGSGNNAFRFHSPDFGSAAKQIYTSIVWDPAQNVLGPGTFYPPPSLLRTDGTVIDWFCCGHTFLPDGRLLAAGGTLDYDKKIVMGVAVDAGHGFDGTREAAAFDPGTQAWTLLQAMQHGRWYPTLVTLDDGSVVAASGLDENGAVNETLERNLDPVAPGPWTKTRDFVLPLYPHLFQLASGQLLFTGGKMDTEGPSVPFTFDPVTPTESTLLPGLQDDQRCNQCASILLPPAQQQKFMILGGGPEDDGPERGRATQRVQVLDLNAPQPTYQDRAPLKRERMHVNAVLLPDRTVLAVGGGVTREASARSNVVDPEGGREVFEAEIYDPALDTWSLTAPATVARLYHSVALLLPDGRVVAAGGNPDKGSQVPWLPPDPLEEMRLEIFSPPYLFKGPRPIIKNAPDPISHGGSIVIRSDQASTIRWVSLIMPGLTTHSFNGTQRLVDVPFLAKAPDQLLATIPNDPKVAPAAWYLLFLTDQQRIPSMGRWVQLV
jgi:Domain of unknown function (DUF1929)/FG-GAP-like repeat